MRPLFRISRVISGFLRPRAACPVAVLVMALLSVCGASAQERADCHPYRSAILHASAGYCVILPADYGSPAAKTKRYPILYLLHPLGGNQGTAVTGGEWDLLQDLRRMGKVGDFLVVAPNGFDSFYINSADGTMLYGDFFLREFMPFIEKTYRVKPGAVSHGITGFSMGGYGAIRIGFAHPELFGSISAHSAVLLRDPPAGISAGAETGNPLAEILAKSFGDPIGRKFWDLNSPFVLAKKNAALLMKTNIYFDCGLQDFYGLNRGAADLHQALDTLKIPHEFHLYPGEHSMEFVLAHSEATFEFHWRAFAAAH